MIPWQGIDTSAIRGLDIATIRAIRDAAIRTDIWIRDASKTIATAVAGGSGSGGGAPVGSPFVTIGNVAGLSAERALAVTSPLTMSDGGANSSVSLGVSIAALAGTPTIAYGTAYAPGVASTFVRTDATFKYPDKLMAPTDVTKRLEFTEDGVFAGILALTGWTRLEIDADDSIGFESLATNNSIGFSLNYTGILTGLARNGITGLGSAFASNDEGIDFVTGVGGAGTTADFTFLSNENCNSSSKAVITILMQPDKGTNQNFGMAPFFIDNAPALSARTVGSWNADMTLSGVWTGATVLVGYDHSTFSITPSTGSGAALNAYGARFRGPSINGTNATFTETATLTLLAGTGQTVTTAYGIKCQLPRSSTTTQVGLDFTNVAGGSTPTDRIGIRVGAATRGTNRTGIQVAVDTGAVAGSHLRLLDKVGDVPAPIAGDVWRNANALKVYDGTRTHDLMPMTTKGDLAVWGTIESRLGVGADGTVLTADSTQAAGLKWAASGSGVSLGLVEATALGMNLN